MSHASSGEYAVCIAGYSICLQALVHAEDAPSHSQQWATALHVNTLDVAAYAHMHSLMAYQPEQPVSNEDKICFVCVVVSDNGVHASNLEVGRYDLQVVVHSTQVWLL